ncbi:MAG: GNAT family N-acetyltransferase [Alistipes sp.]
MKPIKKKEELFNLWHAVAPNDDVTSLRWYCDNMLKSDDDVTTIYDQGKCVAAVGGVETIFCYNGIEIPAAMGGYLCVDPAYRDKGYSIALGISYARYCYGLGIDLILGWEISSKLRRLYESAGHFLFRDYVKRTTISKTDILPCQTNEYRIETTRRNIAKEYNEFVKKRYRNYTIHSEDAFELMRRESDFFMAYDKDGAIQGIAIRLFCTEDHYIEELIAVNDDVKNSLLSHIASYYQWDRFTYSEYGVGVQGAETSHGMIRILNAENMLKRYAALHPEYKDVFTVKDEAITQNFKTYKINQGKCEVVAYDESFKVISVLQLSELLFDGFYLNLSVVY